jgi:hypothetical protein
MKNLIKLLMDYDRYFVMTDDHRIYEAGLNLENKLLEEVKKYELHEMLSYLESLKTELITLKNKL